MKKCKKFLVAMCAIAMLACSFAMPAGAANVNHEEQRDHPGCCLSGTSAGIWNLSISCELVPENQSR